MAQCKECEFYKPIDETKGDCFGHEVPADLDVEKCPTKSFKPRKYVDKLPSTKIDYKKEFPQFYKPSSKIPEILDIPEMNFFMIDGKGDPNTSKEYKNAIEILYNISYTLKMKIIKKETPERDYVVPPLEGLWYMPDMEKWTMNNKKNWQWTMMIRIPDFISEVQIEKAIGLLRETKNPPSLSKLKIKKYKEGKCVQILYIGAYDNEPSTISKIHKFAKEQNYSLNGKHHEIYLSDPRRVNPERLKTVLRQPILKLL